MTTAETTATEKAAAVRHRAGTSPRRRPRFEEGRQPEERRASKAKKTARVPSRGEPARGPGQERGGRREGQQEGRQAQRRQEARRPARREQGREDPGDDRPRQRRHARRDHLRPPTAPGLHLDHCQEARHEDRVGQERRGRARLQDREVARTISRAAGSKPAAFFV